ncbi:MAG TPA: chalcone isomerase family protein [Kofleriaceae bacterium]|nr:chalcone isomerase family protein [Kofleriaceae bacterium]
MRNPIWIALLSIAITAASAFAGKKAGVTMPDTVTIAQKKLVLNGMGLREATFLKVDVYVAGLYLEQVSSDPAQIINSKQIKRLVLRFVRDVGKDDIVKAWNDGFKGNSTVPVEKLKPYIDRLNSWMPSFDDGDTLIFTSIPGEGVGVIVNNSVKGVLKDEDFAKSLFAIWLGPKPPTGDLKKGLLGKH